MARTATDPLPEGAWFRPAEGDEAAGIALHLVAWSLHPGLALAYLAAHSPETYDFAVTEVLTS